MTFIREYDIQKKIKY
ncbi:hypothetical protein [New Jersey aster yellows phytoplasma]